jgi:hypothetical protein
LDTVDFIDDSIIGFATLTGTPIAGALLSRDNGGYTLAIIFAGVTMFSGAAFLLASRVANVGFQLKKKA